MIDLTKEEKIVLFLLSLIILLEGLFILRTNGNLYMYFFGFAFFLSGHFVGMNVVGFGLIFLFSHSVTGMGIMIASMLNIFNNPLLTDLSTSEYCYLIIALSLFIIATTYVIIYNLSWKIKEIKYSKYIPLVIYIIGFLMVGLFNIIIKYI